MLEVNQDEAPVVVHEDVVGVEVADDDAVSVEGGHRLGEGNRQCPNLVGRKGRHRAFARVTLDQFAQGGGVDVLLDQEDVAALLEEIDKPGSQVPGGMGGVPPTRAA